MLRTFALVIVSAGIALAAFLLIPSRNNGNTNAPTTTAPRTCTPLSLADAKAEADLILTGTVFAVVPGEPYARVLITPERVFTGTVPDTGVTVLAQSGGTTSGSGGDLHFTSADPPYLLFLRDRGDGTYTTSRCNGSRLFGAGLTDEEQHLLGSGQPAE